MEELFKLLAIFDEQRNINDQRSKKNENYNQSSKMVSEDKKEVFYKPLYNLYKDDEKSYIEVIVPGFKKTELNILIDDKTLKISGSRILDTKKEKVLTNYKLEKNFSLEFSINENVILNDSIEAKYEDGILLISFKKKTNKTNKNNIIINYV